MAFDLTALTAYIEDQDFPIIAKTQAEGGLASVVNIQTGIKGSSNLQFLDTDVVFGSDSCTRTAADTTTFSQRTIAVGAIAVSEDICVKDLNGYWTQTLVRQGANNENILPEEIAGTWMDRKMNAIKRALTIADFQGDTASGTNNLSYYDGLLKIVDAEGSVVDGNTGAVTVATGITESNVLDILDAMWKAIPTDVMDRDDLSLWLPISVYKSYVVALKNANLYHFNPAEGQETLYGTNVALRPTVGLPNTAGTERMILTYDENITIGMDGDADEDILDVRVDPVSNKSILFDASFKRGVQVAFPEYIVEFTLVP